MKFKDLVDKELNEIAPLIRMLPMLMKKAGPMPGQATKAFGAQGAKTGENQSGGLLNNIMNIVGKFSAGIEKTQQRKQEIQGSAELKKATDNFTNAIISYVSSKQQQPGQSQKNAPGQVTGGVLGNLMNLLGKNKNTKGIKS